MELPASDTGRPNAPSRKQTHRIPIIHEALADKTSQELLNPSLLVDSLKDAVRNWAVTSG
jgi:hypothetical protein